MKKVLRILLPILLSVAIVVCLLWYLFVYDRAFARDVLLNMARLSETGGNHSLATWFYNRAYDHAEDSDSVAIELAEQYKRIGNYTKAELTLSGAIADGGGVDLYIALCKTYVEQDKLLDAVDMLESITNSEIKTQLNKMRPATPTCQPAPGFYNQYLSVTLDSKGAKLYASPKGEYPSVKTDLYTAPIPLTDGENTIYAVSVDENGLVSPVGIYGYTVGGVIEKLEFTDAAFEAEIRKLLKASDSKELYTNDLWSITDFTMPEGVKSYAELKHMAFVTKLTIKKGVGSELSNIAGLSNLEELTIEDTTVSQDVLASIAKLPKLKVLNLTGCGISGISVLADATGITLLNLSGNAIRSVDALSAMKGLQEANLQHNAITNIAPLATLTALTKLDISYNALTTIAPLSAAGKLSWLNASNNAVTGLGSIGDLSTLTYLNLAKNKLKSVNAVASCKALEELDISGNALTDISKLSSLTKLTTLNFANNKVADLPKFPKSCSLVKISGSPNSIKTLDALGGLKNLAIVNMDYNEKISSVKPLADCGKLLEVNVFATKVKSVTVITDLGVVVNFGTP